MGKLWIDKLSYCTRISLWYLYCHCVCVKNNKFFAINTCSGLMLWLLWTSIETQFFQKVTPSYYFEYLSLKNMNFMGSGRLCLFWEGAGVSKNISRHSSFVRTTLFKGYRTMVFRPLTNELMLSFLHKLKTNNV